MSVIKVLILFSLIFFSILLKAQNNKVDSLLQKLEPVDMQDRAHIYNSLAKIDSKNDPQKRIDYATEALKIAKKYNLKREECNALANIATGYSYLGKSTEGLKYDLAALELANDINSDSLLTYIYLNLGYDYYFLGDYQKALEFNLESLKIKNRMFEKGFFDSQKNFARSYNNIGSIYNLLKQPKKAIEYHNKALEIRKRLPDSTGIAQSLHNIGSVFEKQDKYNDALKYYRQALIIEKILGNDRRTGETLNNIGNILKNTGNYSSAYDSYKEALGFFIKIKDKKSQTTVYNNIGSVFLKENKPDSAYSYLIKSIEFSKETGQKKTLSESYENLVDYYEMIADYKNALETQKKFLILMDTLFSEEMLDKVSDMQVKYETEKKEKEIEILARNKEIQSLKIKKQSVQLYILIGLIVFVLVIVILVFNRIKLKQKNVRTELEKKNLETEQRLLRSQMNPHFIFNSMNSIQSYISGNDSFTAMTYLSKFAQLMRNILDNSRKSLISLSDEINTLELYIELERIRFKQKFDYKITIEPELPVESVYIPPMLVQPFVENSIKHGLRNKPEKGLLEIEFRQNNKLITCIVRDNGIGRDKAKELNKEKNKNHRSLGMQVTQERLTALSKGKRTNISFEITDLTDKNGKAEGTQVVINIPYEAD